MEITTKALYDTTRTSAKPLLDECEYPWEALPKIKEYTVKLGNTLSKEDYCSPTENVWIAKSAKIAGNATILPPAIIGPDTELRTGAFIRGAVIVGSGCVVGNSCELKNCILFDGVQVPHFNYIGDSILGYRSHTGAGAVTSNVKSDKTLVVVKNGEEKIETGLKKMGAMLGDFAEIGCNSVLNPGTVIGKHTNVYPLSSVRGCIPPYHIFKSSEQIVPKKQN